MNQDTRRIGFTTTIPVEVLYAAGCTPVDLNNVFITSPDAPQLVTRAEHAGFPRSACGWIKGIYSTVRQGAVDAVIAVVEGDCSQTQAMAEALAAEGVEIIPFSFPHDRDRELLRLHIDKLITRLGTTWNDSITWKRKLDAIRRRVWRLDELSWTRGTVTSFDNHYYQVSCSDFNSDPDAFLAQVERAIERAERSPSVGADSIGDGTVADRNRLLHEIPGQRHLIRLGYIGVPSIFTDLYDFLESRGARVVFNEVQRQFSMPFETDDLVEQYARYTYPYDIFGRIEDIKHELTRRGIAGLIHYTQSFCFRQIQDMIIRKQIDLPILTLEGEFPTALDERTKVRILGFLEMLT